MLVVLDSDHREAHVTRELELYAELIKPGGYLIVQDTNINGHPVLPKFGPGPMEAVQKFLASKGRNFQVDKTKERLLFTMHPSGYLKRGED